MPREQDIVAGTIQWGREAEDAGNGTMTGLEHLMTKLDEICKKVLDKTEWIAISTGGHDGPHVVGTWGDYVRALDAGENMLIIPAGRMHKTEENLKQNNRVTLLCGTRQIAGSHGQPGQGCEIVGTGEFHPSGAHFELVKAKFPWARAALVVHVKEAKTQL